MANRTLYGYLEPRSLGDGESVFFRLHLGSDVKFDELHIDNKGALSEEPYLCYHFKDGWELNLVGRPTESTIYNRELHISRTCSRDIAIPDSFHVKEGPRYMMAWANLTFPGNLRRFLAS